MPPTRRSGAARATKCSRYCRSIVWRLATVRRDPSRGRCNGPISTWPRAAPMIMRTGARRSMPTPEGAIMPVSRSRIVAEVDFEKNGRQQGFLRLFHSVHSSAYGFIPIPIVVLRNGDGPTALLVSGNHGDEYEGQIALCNLAKL